MNKTTNNTLNKSNLLCRVKFVYYPSARTKIGFYTAKDLKDRKDFGMWGVFKKEGTKWVCYGELDGGNTHEELEYIAKEFFNTKATFEFDVYEAA